MTSQVIPSVLWLLAAFKANNLGITDIQHKFQDCNVILCILFEFAKAWKKQPLQMVLKKTS